jgi:hypothetical protein
MMLNIVMYVVRISFFFCLITLICLIFSRKYCKDGFIVYALSVNTIMITRNPHFLLCSSIFSSLFLHSVFAFILGCPLNIVK